MRRSLLGLLLLVAVLAVLVNLTRADRKTASPSAVAAARPETEDALVLLNQASRAAYSQARREALAHSGAVVLVSGDVLILRHGELRSEALALPSRYHTLKSVSHVPLALHALL